MIDLSGQERRRHGRLARHRPGHRRCASHGRAPTSASATARTRPRPPRPRARSRRLGRQALAGRGRRLAARSRRRRSSAPRSERFGKVDILVNNAGITRDDLIMRMSPRPGSRSSRRTSSARSTRSRPRPGPMLKARGGRIVNITSVSGQAGQMGQANYSSAKAGLIGLTKATARELASRGITCNAVAPGFIETELTSELPEALLDRDPRADPARSLRHDRGGRRGRRLPRLGRGRVHHRPGARRRRRPGHDVAKAVDTRAHRPRRRPGVGHPRRGRRLVVAPRSAAAAPTAAFGPTLAPVETRPAEGARRHAPRRRRRHRLAAGGAARAGASRSTSAGTAA